jgi:amino acid adenylation domain-containing protein
LIDLLRWRAAHQPNQQSYTFLLDGEAAEARLAYAEVDRQARAIGALLQDAGAAGERILLLYPPGLDYVAAFFGCLYAGAVAVPAYPPNPARLERTLPRLQAIVNDAQPLVALTTTPILSMVGLLSSMSPDFQKLRWLATDALPPTLADEWRDPAAQPATLAFLQYTSGSTAAPKGVMLTHANLLHNSLLIHQAFAHSTASQGVIWLPPYHDMGLIGGIIQPLYAGFPVTLMSPVDFLQRPLRWLQAISRYHATTSGGPNFAYDLCVRKITPEQRATLDLSSWTVAFNGAEPIRPETLERFAEAFAPCGFRAEAFYPCYGLAEATLIVSGGLAGDQPVVRGFAGAALDQHQVHAITATSADARVLVGSGRVLADQQIAIADPAHGRVCAAGTVGEIWVGGPSVAQGYWRRAELTEQTFHAQLPGSDGSFLRTGDLGFVWESELFVTGRLKDLIIIRGRNHYPQDIELTVERSHPALRPGCGAAVAVDVGGEERLVIVQEVERQHRNVDLDVVAGAVRQAVAAAHEVHAYAVVLLKPGGIPKTSSGKVQRHACRAGYLAGTLETLGSSILEDAPTEADAREWDADAFRAATPAERLSLLTAAVRGAVAQVLHLAASRLDAQQSISRLGLDSLMAVEVQHRLETQLGVVVPMVRFLEDVSIDQLAMELLPQLETPAAEAGPLLVAGADAVAAHPLSSGQRALWFLHQLAPESAAYNVANAVRIRGELDVPALRRAFQRLIERHPALRTTFPATYGDPVQQIHAHVEVAFQEEDASAWSEAALHARLVAEVQRPFDLARGPLLRVHLFARSPQEHILVLALHHIVTDLWSLVVLTDELGALYPAEKAGTPLQLAPLALHYSDYVRWQADMLAGAEGERLWSYWQQNLAGSPVLNLATDRPRPLVQTYHGAGHAFGLDQALTQRLHALAEAQGTTLYTLLLTAFQVLLYRYSGQDDILVGTPIAGRSRAELAGMVGYFVNSVVIRADLSRDPTFQDLLERVRRSVLAAFAHQEYPFVTLVERLQPVRDLSRSPLFQVMFALQKAHLLNDEGLNAFALGGDGARMRVGGLPFEAITLDQRIAQFDLTLTMGEVSGSLAAAIEYNTDLFDAATIQRMAGHLQALLAGIVAEPQRRIAELPLLTEQERRQVLLDWNATQADYPSEASIQALFTAQAARSPNAAAVIFQDTRLSYHELNQQSNQLARHLRALGVGPEVLVGLCVARSPAMMVGILGILKAGGAYVPLDPAYPQERRDFILADAQVALLITATTDDGRRTTDEDAVSAFVDRQVVDLDADWPIIARQSGANLADRSTAAHSACAIYTSGSTGQPKGVLIENGSVVNLITSFARSYEPGAGDSILPLTSLASASFVGEIFPLICAGGTLVLPNENEMLDFEALFSLIARHHVTMLSTVPSTMARLNARKDALPRLRLILSGGEALALSDIDALLETVLIVNGYGLTETTVCSTYYHLAAQNFQPNANIPIGRPIINNQTYILSRQLQAMPIGVPGELYVAGVGLARGYLANPALTAERFVPNPFVTTEDERRTTNDELAARPVVHRPASFARMYRTGDLARWLPEGVIEYLGRIDQQVKIRGFRIELGEIEACLSRHPAVQEAAVLAREDAPGNKRLVAYVVPLPEQKPTISALRSFLQERLPDYMVPAAFVVLDALPLTSNGKVHVAALPVPDSLRPDLEVTYTAPRSELEHTIAVVWQEALKVDKVGIHDNFFELGGHSLLLVQVHSRLRETYSQLSLVDMFKYPTISLLAVYLSPKQTEQPAFEEIQDRARKQRDARDRRKHLMKEKTD